MSASFFMPLYMGMIVHNQETEDQKVFLTGAPASGPPAFVMRQTLFLIIGFVLCGGAFVALQTFTGTVVRDERARMSERLAHEINGTLEEYERSLDIIVKIIKDGGSEQTLQATPDSGQAGLFYNGFSQVLWFYQKPQQGWTFAEFFQRPDSKPLKADAKNLSYFLAQGALTFSKARIVEGVDGFEAPAEGALGSVISSPFVVVQAVETGKPEKGFLVGVITLNHAFDPAWLTAHETFEFLHIHEIEKNKTLWALERRTAPDNGAGNPFDVFAEYRYEVPFAGKTLVISDRMAGNATAHVLMILPFVVVGAGCVLVLAVWFSFENRRKSVIVVAQKNFELQGERLEKARLDRALKNSDKENRSVINSIKDAVFEVDRHGQVVFLNRAWSVLSGFEIVQSLGQNFIRMLHPKDQAEMSDFFAEMLEGTREIIHKQTQILTENGTFRAVELYLSVIKKDAERGIRYIGSMSNMEERRRVEKALGEVEKKYRSIVEHAAGGIYQLTSEGLYLSANPAMARILGYETPEQLLRLVKNCNESVYVNAFQREEFYQDLAQNDVVHNYEFQVHRRDGAVIWVNENARAVKDENGKLLFVEGSIEDITERKESDAEIRRAKIQSDLANRAKSEFLSNMSHELRTPLNSIIGFSEMIKNEVLGPIEQKTYQEYARDIHESGRRLLKVINEILDISKIEVGERQLNEGIVNMEQVVGASLDMLSVKISNAHLSVSLALEGVPEVIGEELALKQIVLNLLSNAVKFTPEGGRITVSAHVGKNGRFHFSVTDTGIGLDEYEIKKALSPFGQMDNALSRSGSGTGLGLTLVDALVKIHGGEFELFSQKGIGTTATMILPAERVVRKR